MAIDSAPWYLRGLFAKAMELLDIPLVIDAAVAGAAVVALGVD